jgi:Spy/CpxP family protein refolding chaperone
MWTFAKPLLVILSVALNSAFMAAWVSQTLPSKKCEHKESECAAIFSQLGVSEEQLQKIKPRLAKFRECSKAQCEEINRLRRELIDLIAAAEPCRETIAAKQKEILESQRKMQELVVEQLLTEKSAFTPEQREKFFDLIRSRCGCGGSGKELGLLEPLPEHDAGRPAGNRPDCAEAADSPKSPS